jgi:hypothetical protein
MGVVSSVHVQIYQSKEARGHIFPLTDYITGTKKMEAYNKKTFIAD